MLNNGIKQRMIGSYLIIIVMTVFVLETFLIMSISRYYYINMENMVKNQIKVSVDFYNSYLSSSSLKKNIMDNADIFWKNTSAEVQIISPSGKMLMDSIGNYIPGTMEGDDIDEALKGDVGSSIETDKNTGEKLLCVSSPLKTSGNTEGIIRFVTSLSGVNHIIKKIAVMLILIGFIVILITGIISIAISNTITKPIRQLTDMANKIAKGRFNERVKKERDDEIGTLLDTLNFMADKILQNEKLKNEFIASVSHELRTPLTSIKGWATTMRTGNLDDKEEIMDGLEIIEKESDRLTKMVEELLDFSKFISGKITLNRDYIDIKSTIKYMYKQLSLRAKRQKLNFKVKVQHSIPPILLDENRIKQVLTNLLDNSFKFTPQDGIVELSVKTEYNNLIIIVKDNGIGIPKDELPRVTEKFFKGKTDKSSNGIGLSICREIVELHNGKLYVDSEYKKGTQVKVSIPIDED
ncbi:HAMP domain-containing histidine kinase [Clostridium tyrobutyricum]|uniref:sensor histidine kinase n=1 Tax=Clostridium tyrobutyricum TaxID=1519 RepID=UPI001C38FF00|nr:HAMP domain-containing sensor histidine kinase [Clostridium tyrobutyricum]MBV4419180.1 HAMP domain-containing histidine kinase [Clostridium tyrobutyricum]